MVGLNGIAAFYGNTRISAAPELQRLFEGGDYLLFCSMCAAYSSKYGIRKTMKCSYRPQWEMSNLVLIRTWRNSSDAGKVYNPS